MAEAMRARRARGEISIDGVQLPASVMQDMIELKYTDNEEDSCDDLSVTFADREGKWLSSWAGEVMKASAADRRISARIIEENFAGDGEKIALDCGEFELDDISVSAPPNTVTLKATSLPYAKEIRKTEKSKVWKSIRLSGIAGEIAKLGGLELMYLAGDDPLFEREEQFKEADISFLSHLCHKNGIALKSTDGKLVLFAQSEFENRGSVGKIRRSDRGWLKFSAESGQANTKYGSCVVRYCDPDTGKVIEGRATDEDGDALHVLLLCSKVETKGDAEKLARAYLRWMNKFEISASFTFPGNPAYCAGQNVELEGFGEMDGKFVIARASHTVGGGGFQTAVKLRKVRKL